MYKIKIKITSPLFWLRVIQIFKMEIVFFCYIARFTVFIKATNRNPQIIVSLTSIPPRFSQLHLVIKSILQQTLLPDRLVLWLSKEHKNKNFLKCSLTNLPKKIQNLQKNGLEIYFTKDIGSYRKLIPSLKKFPNDIIITIDDDILYEKHTIKNLYSAYLQNGKQKVYCQRSRLIERRVKKGKVEYTANTLNFTSKNNDKKLFFTTGGGTLFPPHILYKDVFQESILSKLTPFEDDSWFNIMTRLNNKSVFQINSTEINSLPTSSKYPLSAFNLQNNRTGFNQQLNALIRYYKLKL